MEEKKPITIKSYTSGRRFIPRIQSTFTFFATPRTLETVSVETESFSKGAYNHARAAKKTRQQKYPTMVVLEPKAMSKSCWRETIHSARYYETMRQIGLMPTKDEPAIFGGEAQAKQLTKIIDPFNKPKPDIWRLVVPYCPGTELFYLLNDKELPKENKLNNTQKLSVFYQIADSLKQLWDKKKFIHGDVRSTNIMVETDMPITSVFDFGIQTWLIDGGRSKKKDETVTYHPRENYDKNTVCPYYHAPEIIPLLKSKNWDPANKPTTSVYLWGKAILGLFLPYLLSTDTSAINWEDVRASLAKNINFTTIFPSTEFLDILINTQHTDLLKIPSCQDVITLITRSSLTGTTFDPRYKIPAADSKQDVFALGHTILESIVPYVLREIDNKLQINAELIDWDIELAKLKMNRKIKSIFTLEDTLELLLRTQRKDPAARPDWQEIVTQFRKELLITKFAQIDRTKNLNSAVIEAAARDPRIGEAIYRLAQYIPTRERIAFYRCEGFFKKQAIDDVFIQINIWFKNPYMTFEKFKSRIREIPLIAEILCKEQDKRRKTRLGTIIIDMFSHQPYSP